MTRVLSQIFTAHPASVNETYFEHMRFASGFAARLFGAAIAASIHAIIPCLFEKTASRMVREMHERIINR